MEVQMPSHLGSESWTWKASGHAGDYPIYFAIDPVGLEKNVGRRFRRNVGPH